MIKRRKKKFVIPETESADDVSTVYGDMVTFVMMLFVLLFVMSYNKQQNKDFFTQMSEKMGGKQEQHKESATTEAILVSKMKNFIKKEKLNKETQILVNEQKIQLVLSHPVLFKSGSAKLSRRGHQILKEMAAVFRGVQNPIIIDGHTDNVPIHNNEYKNNWELSFARAFSVIDFLVEIEHYKPENISGTGYGKYRPLKPNTTPEDRALNRRIEVNVIRILKT